MEVKKTVSLETGTYIAILANCVYHPKATIAVIVHAHCKPEPPPRLLKTRDYIEVDSLNVVKLLKKCTVGGMEDVLRSVNSIQIPEELH